MDREDWKYEYWFANIKGVGNRTKRRLRECMKTAKEIYYIEETKLQTYLEKPEETAEIIASIRTWDLEAEYQKIEKQGITFLPYFHKDYPQEFTEILRPPYAVYLKGKPLRKSSVKAAIVGARQCSPYGEYMAIEFAQALADAGIDIISGLARGVDGAAQRGALNAGGISYGVLGCGVDVCYPRENIGLYVDLQERGGIISEQPLGASPLPQHFPARNRLISALADIVLVMEAKERSGSLITADQALEQGKDIYALPGPVNSELSKGCNRLIRQGAGILLSPEDLLKELKISGRESVKKKLKNQIMLETEENIVYSCLGLFPKDLHQLTAETGMGVSALMNQLVSLELRGYIREISKNYYVKNDQY